MAEGLSASEVGKEIGEHNHAAEEPPKDRRDRLLSITEATTRRRRPAPHTCRST